MYRSVPIACFLIVLLTGVSLETSAQKRSELALRVFDHEGEPAVNVRAAFHPEPCTTGMKAMQVISKTNAEGKLYTKLPHRNPPCMWLRWQGHEFLFPLSSDAAEQSGETVLTNTDTVEADNSGSQLSEKLIINRTIRDLRGNIELKVEVLWKFSAETIDEPASDGVVTGRLFGLVASNSNGENQTDIKPMSDAVIDIPDRDKKAIADSEGRFRLKELPREQPLQLRISFAPAGVNDTLELHIPRDSDVDLGETLYYYLPEQ